MPGVNPADGGGNGVIRDIVELVPVVEPQRETPPAVQGHAELDGGIDTPLDISGRTAATVKRNILYPVHLEVQADAVLDFPKLSGYGGIDERGEGAGSGREAAAKACPRVVLVLRFPENTMMQCTGPRFRIPVPVFPKEDLKINREFQHVAPVLLR